VQVITHRSRESGFDLLLGQLVGYLLPEDFLACEHLEISTGITLPVGIFTAARWLTMPILQRFAALSLSDWRSPVRGTTPQTSLT